MLVVQNVGCIRGSKTLFNHVSFKLGEGQVAAILGINGSGKTSLLRIVCGLIPPTTGHVTWDARPLSLIGDTFKQATIYLGHYPSFKPDLHVLENLRSAVNLSGAPQKTSLFKALERVGLDGLANTPCYELSSGQKKRLTLARLIAQDAKLWILDEPANSLDSQGLILLEELLSSHLDAGGIAVVATHSPLRIQAKDVQVIKLTKEKECSAL